MPNPTFFNDNLCRGLSSFWLRMFADREALDAMYQATEQQLGQAYLDVLEAVLAPTLSLAPVYHREYWQLAVFRADEAVVIAANTLYPAPASDITLLQNKILVPDVIFERDRDFEVVTVDGTPYVRFVTDPFTADGVAYRHVDTENGPVKLVAFWAPDVSVDSKVLSDNYGYLVGQGKPSSETYRTFLQTIFKYYIRGPVLKNVEAVLNVASGIPVVETEGEVITALPDGTDTVVTNKQTYLLPVGSRRSSLVVGQVLQAFAPLSTVFRVVDHVTDPTWWWNIVIPKEALPDESSSRRQVTPQLYPLIYDDASTARYGDPGLYYGADDNYDETHQLAPATRPPLYHNFGYTMMDRVLKHNMFGVYRNASLSPDFDSNVLTSVVIEGKPAYTYMYVAP